MDFIEGEDGRLYLHYGKGASYQIYNRSAEGSRGGKLVTARIFDCGYDYKTDREEYAVETEKTGGKTVAVKRYEREELEFYLSEGNAEELEAGIAVEAPLLPGEVRDYYYDLRARRRQAIDTAKGMLEGNKDRKGKPEYRELIDKQKAVGKRLARAVAEETDEIAALSAEYGRLCEQRKAMIKDMGIDPRLFLPEQECPLCGGMGIIKHVIRKGDKEKGEQEVSESEICACAYEREAEIKAYARAERVGKRLSKDWAAWQSEPSTVNQARERLGDEQPPQIQGESSD